MIRDIISPLDLNSTFHDGIVLHVAHGYQIVHFGNTQPVENIWHQRLEAHIFDARDKLGGLEVPVCRVAAAFAEIVHEISGGMR